MLRAAVLIGVSKAGNLPELKAVEAGIGKMRAWAEGQGINGDRLVVLTDKSQPLRAYQVADAITGLVERRDLDQLIVYFSGHGIWNQSERWLLSGAPAQAAEAVNVDGSIQLARYCGINHVVLMADACRTAAEGIQGLSISGTEIFPNTPVDGMERPVDVFFACARGKPALEVTVAGLGALGEEQVFGLYTEVLAECLLGHYADVREPEIFNEEPVDFIRAWNLQKKLTTSVPQRLQAALGKIPTVNQFPVARFSSMNGWISCLPRSPLKQLPRGPFDSIIPRHGHADHPAGDPVGPRTMPSVADALHAILSDILAGRINKLAVPLADDASIEESLRAEIVDLIQSMRPGPYPMSCGFSVHGARVAAARSNNRNVACRIRDSEQGLVSVDTNRAASVLLEMADGTGVVMPAIPGFVASLVFRAGELAHVGYEATSPAGPAEHLDSVRALGATLGVAAGLGFLQLHKRDVLLLAKRFAAWFPRADPALALYYAYACQDAGMRSLIKDVAFQLWMSMTPYFFDINLLANQEREGKQQWPVVPAFPLLSRGWSLLNAFGATLPAEWRDLQRHLRPSLWSLFDKEGTERLRTLFNPPKE